MNTVDIVKMLCKERKVPVSRLEKDLGFSNGYIGQLRKGTFPHDRLFKIADYFSVSVDYLLGKEDQKEKDPVISDEVSEQRKRLMEQLSSLSPDQLDQALSYIEFLASNSKK